MKIPAYLTDQTDKINRIHRDNADKAINKCFLRLIDEDSMKLIHKEDIEKMWQALRKVDKSEGWFTAFYSVFRNSILVLYRSETIKKIDRDAHEDKISEKSLELVALLNESLFTYDTYDLMSDTGKLSLCHHNIARELIDSGALRDPEKRELFFREKKPATYKFSELLIQTSEYAIKNKEKKDFYIHEFSRCKTFICRMSKGFNVMYENPMYSSVATAAKVVFDNDKINTRYVREIATGKKRKRVKNKIPKK